MRAGAGPFWDVRRLIMTWTMRARHRGVNVFSPQSREVPAIRMVQQALDAQRRPSALQGRWSPPPLHRMYFNNVLGSGELQ